MRLTRSRDDVVVAGVLAGLGNYFNIDPTLLRIGFVILAFTGVGGALIPLYILGAILIPKEPYDDRRKRRNGRKVNRQRRRKSRRQERRDYDTMNQDNNYSSSNETNNIDEEDWSDF